MCAYLLCVPKRFPVFSTAFFAQVLLRSLLLFWPRARLNLLMVWDDENMDDHLTARQMMQELKR
jgi:hypothetical protein